MGLEAYRSRTRLLAEHRQALVERGRLARPFSVVRAKALDGLEDWVSERFRQHAGNADVVRQELATEKVVTVSLRIVERAVAPLRQELRAKARATVRFETHPGQQLQIDFGERQVEISGTRVKVFFFVATLGYSRRLPVRAFFDERQEHWFEGMEGAFRRFGGVPEEVLLDNARALISHHDPATREVTINPRLHAFARHWGFRVCACAPYRARTKGKAERGVGYVRRNAIAGRRFESFAALEDHLEGWIREIEDTRIHGTTGEPPYLRFSRDEAHRLKPLDGIPALLTSRELVRPVSSDRAVEVDGNAYSVPWQLIGERVNVLVTGTELRVSHAGQEVACHRLRLERRARIVDRTHFEGITGGPLTRAAMQSGSETAPVVPELLRPLSEYEAVAGGAW
nr:IS21 family transposase [Paracoccus saliphilus]